MGVILGGLGGIWEGLEAIFRDPETSLVASWGTLEVFWEPGRPNPSFSLNVYRFGWISEGFRVYPGGAVGGKNDGAG